MPSTCDPRLMTEIETPPDAGGRAGMVAVVGRANVGKSTLVNAMLGEKISIVSPVAQTTRNLIRGVLTEPRGQLVFLDTPGVHKAVSDLGKTMNRVARAATEGVDIVLLVLDASVPPRMEDEGWMRRLHFDSATVIAVLNKWDQPHPHVEDYRQAWGTIGKEKGQEREIVWAETSARGGSGVKSLVALLFEHTPLGPLLFPEDVLTDFPRRLAMADTIREKYLYRLTQELPHQLAVWVEEIDEGDEGWTVSAVVYVARQSQKGIVIGKKGRLLKRVREESERELSELFERPVKLDLWVKVEKDWSGNFFFLRQLGYG